MAERPADESPRRRPSPVDLLVAIGVSGVAIASLQVPNQVPDVVLTLSSGLVVLFFVGYCALDVVFPRFVSDGEAGPLEPVERIVLAIGLSLVIVPLLALVVAYSPVALVPQTVLTAGCLFTVLAALVALGLRRRQAPAESHEMRSQLRTTGARLRRWQTTSLADRALDVAVVASLLFATAAIGYVAVADPDQQPYSEFTVLAENATGAIGAGDYPLNLTRNETRTMCLIVGNHERQRQTYTMHVVIERRETNNSSRSATRQPVNRTTLHVEEGTTQAIRYALRPPDTGERFRVRFHLYRDEMRDNTPRREPYRALDIPVTVSGVPATDESASTSHDATCPSPARAVA